MWWLKNYNDKKLEKQFSSDDASLEEEQRQLITTALLDLVMYISYQIRNPISHIDTVLAGLKTSELDVHTQHALSSIQEQVLELEHTVTKLLGAEQLIPVVTKTLQKEQNFHFLINDLIIAYSNHRAVQVVNFVIDRDTEDLYFVFNYRKMTIVLLQLIDSVVYHTVPNGQVHICIKKQTPKQEVCIKIYSDTIVGKGIDAPIHAHVRILQEFIQQHNGRITTIDNKGYEVVFPLQAAYTLVSTSKLKHTVPTVVMADTTIYEQINGIESTTPNLPKLIVVSSIPKQIKAVYDALAATYMIRVAATARGGIKLAKELVPELLVIDEILPGTSGVQLCKKIKKDIIIHHIPIILLQSTMTTIKGIESGADVSMRTPVEKELLQAYSKNLIHAKRKLKDKISREFILTPKELSINTVDQEFIKLLMQIMEANFDKFDFDVHQLSEMMNLSYRALARRMKAVTNQTANEFLRNVRLKKAAALLGKGKLPISEVSNAVGFSDPAYFSRCFQKQYGVPPSKYAAY